MGHYQHCKSPCRGIVQDFLQSAPCPPPMLSHREFRVHALSRNLTHLDICSISLKCRPADPDVEEDCRVGSARSPYAIIIIIVVCAVSVLAVTFFIIQFVLNRRQEKKSKQHDDVQDQPFDSAGNLDDRSPASDIQMTENRVDGEEHNRRKGSDSYDGNKSNDKETESDIKTSNVLELSHYSDEESSTLYCTKL
ncbi:uncharacterized protein LOC123525349 [Mercenaria mercenaria]|uniref:uncharacterized protein LOC123525349 n=1 Tax=Mercenaria mercenaria TaxID=6596 RepID=UPI00234E9126|nr:uncharacterized protein LOC123525349 [Mercenaria mercenaria]